MANKHHKPEEIVVKLRHFRYFAGIGMMLGANNY